jgi:CheY-like chemotaxis protein
MRVRLPLETASELGADADASRTADRDAERMPLAGCRVLVVDDEADIRELLRTALAFGGATVRSAGSVDEGLAQVEAEPPDVLVSDLAMPDRDGFEMLRRVREAGATMPVVALTALASATDRKRALAAGFDAYLVKPVAPPFLVATIARVWAKAGATPSDGAASLAARGPHR